MGAGIAVSKVVLAGFALFGSSLNQSAEKPYPPVPASEGCCVTPTEQQKLWALATCAVLTESNGARHDLLGGRERTPKNILCAKKCLADWWGVNNRDDLLDSLQWIINGGHRQDFDALAQSLEGMTPKQIAEIRKQLADDPERLNRVNVVLHYKDEFGTQSLMAWDYDRYVALCGWGYVAGYLTEEEAWARIMPVACLLQRTFDSWEALGNNHVIGREFWSWKNTKKRGALTRECCSKLLNDPSSPWNLLPWDTDLGCTPPVPADVCDPTNSQNEP